MRTEKEIILEKKNLYLKQIGFSQTQLNDLPEKQKDMYQKEWLNYLFNDLLPTIK